MITTTALVSSYKWSNAGDNEVYKVGLEFVIWANNLQM
jgi:hypothetical protein